MLRMSKPVILGLLALILSASLALFALNKRAHDEGENETIKTGIQSPSTIEITPGHFSYRLPGEFLKKDTTVNAPKKEVALSKPLYVMENLVSSEDYARCVSEGACRPADNRYLRNRKGLPVTGVSHDDATRYAQWLSEKTEYFWRLPTDKEWSYYAGERYYDDAVLIEDIESESNPALRWIAEYKRQSTLATQTGPMPRILGGFGRNKFRLNDISGNVWEWTNTCFQRFHILPDQELKGSFENCGVLVAQGKHRAYISSFIQDAKSGGCAVGVPPDNLGFRLIREDKAFSLTRLITQFKQTIRAILP